MSGKTTKRILVIEDDASAAKLAQYTLQEEGYDVVVAPDGQVGIEMATSEEKIDLIVLDIMLPGMSGFEVSRRLRDEYQMVTLPILMLTAKAGEEERFTWHILTEATAYMSKPADPAALVETVETLLEQYPRNSTVTGQGYQSA